MALAQIQADRRRLVHDHAVVVEGRDAGVGIELEVGGAAVLALVGIDPHQFVRRADLLERGVGRHAGGAGFVVELVHRVVLR
jgi:hypothetical protein